MATVGDENAGQTPQKAAGHTLTPELTYRRNAPCKYALGPLRFLIYERAIGHAYFV